MKLMIDMLNKAKFLKQLKYILFFASLTLFFCVHFPQVKENFNIHDNQDYENEYLELQKRIIGHRLIINKIGASDDLFSFLGLFEKVFAPLEEDFRLYRWLYRIGIASEQDVKDAYGNLRLLIHLNEGIFFQYLGEDRTWSDEESKIIKAWENVFGAYVPPEQKQSLRDIEQKINAIEQYFFKNPIKDFKTLSDYKKLYTELIKLRNSRAKILGLDSYIEQYYSKEKIELLTSIYSAIMKNVVDLKERDYTPSGLITPDTNSYFLMLATTLKNMGLSLNNDIQYYISQQPVRAYTYPINLNDCRININLPESKTYHTDFINNTSILFHETGHALHFQNFKRGDYILNKLNPQLTESVAIFFENIIYSEHWLTNYYVKSLKPQDILGIIEARKSEITEYLRQSAFIWLFESILYLNPTQDVDKLYLSLKTKLGIEQLRFSRIWIDLSIFGSKEFYYNNYTFGFIYAYLLKNYCRKIFGEQYYENPACGKFIIDNILKYNNSLTCEEVLKPLFDLRKIDLTKLIYNMLH